jgi:hypothetical protein
MQSSASASFLTTATVKNIKTQESNMCEGDKISGYDSSQVCYRLEGCMGCDKCIVKCDPPCENCPTWEGTKPRDPEPGDQVVVQQPILDLVFKGKWTPAMEMAVGRIAWVKNGNPVDGYTLKFTTTSKDILDQFVYPLTALKLSFPSDHAVDKMIKITKQGSINEEM